MPTPPPNASDDAAVASKPKPEFTVCWKCHGVGRSGRQGQEPTHCKMCDGSGKLLASKCPRVLRRQRARAAREAAAGAEGKAPAAASTVPPWATALTGLNEFPMQATTLDPNIMVASLDQRLRDLVFSYTAGFMKAAPELRQIFEAIVAADPNALRVKELFETAECFQQAAAFAVEANKVRPIETIFDLACGHGLLGALLGYRFPHKRIVCVDLERRAGFDVIVGAFEQHGEKRKSPDRGVELDVLGNVQFVEGDLRANLALARSESLALAIHACHEANQLVIEGARAVGAAWGVMPCCIRDGIYLPCGIRGSKSQVNGSDDFRHALLCGAVGATYGAERIQCIDRRITNRNIFLFGGAGFGSREEYQRVCSTQLCESERPAPSTGEVKEN
mmetsp:Transcript_80833/g.224925  ORF Transcript_80833/g.224925 Transcript_80833/m.224925 type:complete len:391 (-) Transcript_80833:93-1265(-)